MSLLRLDFYSNFCFTIYITSPKKVRKTKSNCVTKPNPNNSTKLVHKFTRRQPLLRGDLVTQMAPRYDPHASISLLHKPRITTTMSAWPVVHKRKRKNHPKNYIQSKSRSHILRSRRQNRNSLVSHASLPKPVITVPIMFE